MRAQPVGKVIAGIEETADKGIPVTLPERVQITPPSSIQKELFEKNFNLWARLVGYDEENDDKK